MNAFAFPQPGERQNEAAIPVPEQTLAALVALARVGKLHLTTAQESFVTPQCDDALNAVQLMLSDRFFQAALDNARQMQQDLDGEYPF